jgi:excinuclease UvrABC nuclease subunit
LSIDIELGASPADWKGASEASGRFPAKPGVFALFDAHDRTITIFTTANLRRAIAARLEPPAKVAPLSKTVDYRELTHRIRACTVGSAFEADWAYLQLARKLLPQSYRAMLDRWQAWFIHCDPTQQHPQWVKTAHPNRMDAGTSLGPFPDKHAAARYMDMLQDAFDLCRYHHILVQAPHAAACAYKEMGRCPAPCDGSISLDEYRARFGDSIAFGSTPIATWRADIEQKMNAASAALDFENAARLQRMLHATKPATRAELAHVNRLEEFRYIALAPAERKNWLRAFVISGGWIEPVLDLPIESSKESFEAFAQCLGERASQIQPCFSETCMENVGLVCWHLFGPRAAKPRLEFLRLDQLTGSALRSAANKLIRRSRDDEQAQVADQGIGDM